MRETEETNGSGSQVNRVDADLAQIPDSFRAQEFTADFVMR